MLPIDRSALGGECAAPNSQKHVLSVVIVDRYNGDLPRFVDIISAIRHALAVQDFLGRHVSCACLPAAGLSISKC
jgi:hypothetical protein